ncbi:MAG: DinB family protein [Acidobacteriota bacterium]
MSTVPEPWLRGPLPGISAELQPVAHALVAALEDTTAVVEALDPSEVWADPGGAASIGFHLLHLAGATDRLFTYARGEALSGEQKAALGRERTLPDPRPTGAELLEAWRAVVDRAMAELRATPDAVLPSPRGVGRAQLPTTVRGLLFHAAEHAQRHAGQMVTTAKILRGRRG